MRDLTRAELMAMVTRLVADRDRWKRLSRINEARARKLRAQLAEQGQTGPKEEAS